MKEIKLSQGKHALVDDTDYDWLIQYKGVSLHKASGRWHSRMWWKGKAISLGYYKSEIDAAKAYSVAAT